MVKNLQDYLKTGRDPAYLKNGDTITEELARELICAGDEDGCLDGEFEITQSRIVEDIIGGEGVYDDNLARKSGPSVDIRRTVQGRNG